MLIKRGAGGVMWAGVGAVQGLPTFPGEAADTVAAGDACNGSLTAAALSVARPGAQDSRPDRTEAAALLA